VTAKRADFAVIGGGIVGLAAARRLLQDSPRRSGFVFEKEPSLAFHQTGRNSGVIHSGLYYAPGSKKATLCVEGAQRMIAFCRERGIDHDICGKLVVATNESELPALMELARRAQANGVPGLRELDALAFRQIEPHCAGVKALHVPGTGIVDFAGVARAFAEDITVNGGTIHTHCMVQHLQRKQNEWILQTPQGEFRAGTLLNCGGLFSDRLARAAGAPTALKIVPFRGEYYELKPERSELVRNLIYPVPDARFPFLGVHFTRRIGGGVECGPNAVLAWKREGYSRLSFSPRDSVETLGFGGFWRMAAKHWKTGVGEMHRSFSKAAFVRALQKLVPDLRADDIHPGSAGVRAQAVLADGSLVNDFQFARSEGALHVLNAPSPAATASLAIADEIAREILAS